MELAFLLDAPDTETTQHPIARLGTYRDPRYGKFSITPADVDGWQRNLEATQNGRIPIDYDHAPERGGSTEAAGWITGLRIEGDLVVATIEWTPQGAEAVKDKRWQFVSPTFTSRYKDEQGKDRGPALLGVALTNRPFLRKGMPAISLSHADLAFAERVDPDPPAVFDSPAMDTIAKALGLDPAADEDAIVAAITELRSEPEPKSLDELAAADGKVVLDAEQVKSLQSDAAAGRAAADQLHELTFANAFDKALAEGRVDAKPETRELHRKLYSADAESALKLLADAPQIVSTAPRGDVGTTPGDSTPAPDGATADPERAELDARVQARIAETGEDYTTALNAITAGAR